jgi:uncharacterized protein YqeY
MNLEQQVMAEMKEAMKAKDEASLAWSSCHQS